MAVGIVGAAVAKPAKPKPVTWLGNSRERLQGFPEDVKNDVGAALMWAQMGDKHPDAKVMRGFSGASVLEIVEDYDGDTYRAVYTVKFPDRVYVLHCFQKKSKKGNETPKHDIDLISKRFREAKELEKRRTKKVQK